MIIEGSSVPDGEVIEADICIVGAGPAGLTLASELDGGPFRVYVLEAGGEHPDERSRAMSEGESVGYRYFPLHEARERVFGGASYSWEEWMRARPLDRIDFETRDWIPDSGWPLTYDELNPYYERAHSQLDLGPFDYDVDRWSRGGRVRVGRDDVEPVLFRYSNTADFTTRRSSIDASANVCVLLRATALEVVPGDLAIDHVLATAGNPHRFKVDAKIFVVAAGGIEGPRLLLLSRSRSPRGVGNAADLVGRYFMEHPRVGRGFVAPAAGLGDRPFGAMDQHVVDGSSVRVALAPTRSLMEREGILNGMALLTRSTEAEASEARRSLATIRARLSGERADESVAGHVLSLLAHPFETTRALGTLRPAWAGAAGYRVSITVEQAPNETSRVTLGKGVDGLGQQVASLDWRLGEVERHTMRVIQQAIDEELRIGNQGTLRGLVGDERPARHLQGEWHQMGTTRMARSPTRGVVDGDGRVHGVTNLFVTGSSVFPTVGYANPTLTIVALALRLAGHLATELEGQPALGAIW